MKKVLALRALILVLLLIVSIIVAGCSGGYQSAFRPPVGAKKAETITVRDCAGRIVEVPVKVERIGCLYAFCGHVVAMLGKGENIVAVVEGLKRDKLLTEMLPNIKEAAVPSTGGAVNLEELINADPDVVFIRGETARSEGEMEKLAKSGIPYLVVDYRNIKEQQYAIDLIGQATGAREKAQRYNEYYRRCIERVQKDLEAVPANKRVRVYHSVNEATRTDARDTLPADWMQVAGANNVSVNQDLKLIEDKYFAGLEQIILWDPAVILVNEAGVADYILNSRQWSSLSAVKNRKVYQMPNGISRWGHPGSLETPMAILWTAKTLYPDLFSGLNMVSETKFFYKEFYNYDLPEEVVLQILSGKGMRVSKESAR